MSQITPNSKVVLTLTGILTVGGALLYAGWFANGLLHDIKDELSNIRADIKAVSSDRWTGRDMRDWGVETERLNARVVRGDTETGLILPDVERIQRRNHRENN